MINQLVIIGVAYLVAWLFTTAKTKGSDEFNSKNILKETALGFVVHIGSIFGFIVFFFAITLVLSVLMSFLSLIGARTCEGFGCIVGEY